MSLPTLWLAATLVIAVLASDCAPSVSAVASGASSTSAATTEYFYGTVSRSSPDGKVPYGPPAMTLMRCDLDPGSDRITITTTLEGKTQVTTLDREEGGLFRASTSDNALGGTLEYDGDAFRWTNWRYAIAMSDGSGTIEGTGTFDGKWMETEKYFVSSNGERRQRIIDRLVKITPEEYQRRLGELTAAATPKAPATAPASKKSSKKRR